MFGRSQHKTVIKSQNLQAFLLPEIAFPSLLSAQLTALRFPYIRPILHSTLRKEKSTEIMDIEGRLDFVDVFLRLC